MTYNKVYFGDCLDVMRDMENESVDLIYLDPPFNKGRNFSASLGSLATGADFRDRWSWDKDVNKKWIDQITDDKPQLIYVIKSARNAHSDSMGAYVCFMAIRLLAMYWVLKPTGSIYLHCDPTASHYLKAVMDAIFGWRNFKNEIIWCYKSGGGSSQHFSRKHDVILFYVKNKQKVLFNTLKIKSYDNIHKGGNIVKYYSDEKGRYSIVNARDWWNISIISTVGKERTGYPTQKPLALLERIINASSNEGDLVLDPFCGSGTTLAAAQKLQRQWIGIDINGQACKIANLRLRYKRGLE